MKSFVPCRIRQAAQEEAAKYGAEVSFSRASKHPWKMTITKGDQHRAVALSLNSLTNQIDWIRQDVRRLARELQ